MGVDPVGSTNEVPFVPPAQPTQSSHEAPPDISSLEEVEKPLSPSEQKIIEAFQKQGVTISPEEAQALSKESQSLQSSYDKSNKEKNDQIQESLGIKDDTP